MNLSKEKETEFQKLVRLMNKPENKLDKVKNLGYDKKNKPNSPRIWRGSGRGK